MKREDQAAKIFTRVEYDFNLQFPKPGVDGEYEILALRMTTADAAKLAILLGDADIVTDEFWPTEGQGFLGWTEAEILEASDEELSSEANKE